VKVKFFVILLFLVLVVSFLIGSNVLPLFVDSDVSIFGVPGMGRFYGPFQILKWHFVLDFSGSQRALYVTYGIMIFSFCVLTMFLFLFFRRRQRKANVEGLHGSSRWMRGNELKESGMLCGRGLVLGQTRDAKFKEVKVDFSGGKGKVEKEKVWKMLTPGSLLFNDAPEHVLIIAPTRRGKGINNVIPSLLSWRDSCVVYDLKKENWDKTAGWRSKFSHVLCFEPTSETSVGFNPLMEIRKGPNEVADTQNLCEMLSNPFGTTKKDHWSISATALLVGVVLFVLYNRKEKTLRNVYHELNNPDVPVMKLFEKMSESEHSTIAEVARNVLNKTQKSGEDYIPTDELNSIISSASSYLMLFADPLVGNATSRSDFTINDLMDGEYPISLYLVVHPRDVDRMTPLTRIVISMIGKQLTGAGIKKRKHKLLFLIDEFPALGKLDFFETQLAFFAGYGIKCMIITQSFGQLYKHYSKDTSIPANCRIKVILGADQPEEAEILSKFLGKETVKQTSVTHSGKDMSLFLTGKSEAHSETGRFLMTSDEVLRLPFDEIAILVGGNYPYNAKKVMYYIDSRFIPRAGLPPPNSAQEQERYLPPPSYNPWFDVEEIIDVKYEEEGDEGSSGSVSYDTGMNKGIWISMASSASSSEVVDGFSGGVDLSPDLSVRDFVILVDQMGFPSGFLDQLLGSEMDLQLKECMFFDLFKRVLPDGFFASGNGVLIHPELLDLKLGLGIKKQILLELLISSLRSFSGTGGGESSESLNIEDKNFQGGLSKEENNDMLLEFR